jgi:Recombination endonuclease VII
VARVLLTAVTAASGFSRSTVMRALSSRPDSTYKGSLATRQHIQSVASAMGYVKRRPNGHADRKIFTGTGWNSDPIVHDFSLYSEKQLADLLGISLTSAYKFKAVGILTWKITGRWVCSWCQNRNSADIITCYLRGIKTGVQRGYCKRCHTAYVHGVLWAVYQQWLKDGCCVPVRGGIPCGSKENLHVDHDHKHCPGPRGCPGCVRGIVCTNHNTHIGYIEAEDTPSIIQWLAEWRKNHGIDPA